MKPEEQLKLEGFSHIFNWHDEAGAGYESHAHKDKVSFFVTAGSVKFYGGIDKEVRAGERFDVPAGTGHSALVGPDGCDWVVGEMIEGDS